VSKLISLFYLFLLVDFGYRGRPSAGANAPATFYVLMILRPVGRFLTGPLPPADFAARPLAAVIRPPLLFFAIIFSFLFFDWIRGSYGAGIVIVFESIVTEAMRANARPSSVAPLARLMD
jgi:hypothetical protein